MTMKKKKRTSKSLVARKAKYTKPMGKTSGKIAAKAAKVYTIS